MKIQSHILRSLFLQTFVIAFAMVHVSAFAQTCPTTPVVTPIPLTNADGIPSCSNGSCLDGRFPTPSTGYIVGDNGSISYWNGTQLTQVTSPTTANLNGVDCCVDASGNTLVVAVGDRKTIVISVNGSRFQLL